MKHLTPEFKGMWVLVILLLYGILGISQTNYQTIENGDWTSASIWSTDGVTSCECVPPMNMNGIEVTVSHTITSSANLHIQGGSILTVAISGSLIMPDKELNVQDGSFISNGQLHLGALDAGNAGYVLLTAAATIESKFLILGAIDIMFDEFDTLKIISADVHINPGAVLNTANACIALFDGDFDNGGEAGFDNASVCTYDGDIVNKGDMSFSGNTCAEGSGDFVNKGIVSGQGAITMDGMVDNSQGDWTGIFWCGMEGEDMPMEMDCQGADSICALTGQDIPLDIHHVILSAACSESSVMLSWELEGNLDEVTFYLERAAFDMAFKTIYSGSMSPDRPQSHSVYEDRSPLHGVNYYRLRVNEKNEQILFSPVIAVQMQSRGPADMLIFPNPVTGNTINVLIRDNSGTVTGLIEFYSLSGQLLNSTKIEQLSEVVFEVRMPDQVNAPCLVRFISESVVLEQLVMIQLN